jgi:tellurite resistance protein TehA-like permease
MGTGVVASLLHQLPYNGIWLETISIVIFVLNVAIFATMLTLTLARYLLYPEAWQAVLRHDVQSFCLANFPMGFATIINMTVFVCVPIWQPGINYVVWAMWWLDIVLSAASCFLLTFAMSVILVA